MHQVKLIEMSSATKKGWLTLHN